LLENFSIFARPWVYLHRSMSGKYRVVKLTDDSSPFDYLKSERNKSLPNGIYVDFGEPRLVGLMESNVDLVDFFFPNGGFNDKRYEMISYITDDKPSGMAAPFMTPPTELPPSETQGIGLLDLHGNAFTNLPAVPKSYVHRQPLEEELATRLSNDRHPILTLVGRGGIGKTSLALAVLHELAKHGNFQAMVWFSARDVDLLPEGPKIVRPHILTQRDIAAEFVRLVEPAGYGTKGYDSLTYMQQALQVPTTEIGGPVLYVFDNFETLLSPGDLYSWIDTFIRLPNKVLITTRSRHFKADYPIDVTGMTEEESVELMDSTAASLGIQGMLTTRYRSEVYQEADGHPYVIKILLGEVAKAGRLVDVERIVATKDEILDALFERTYSGLSPAAKRVFLTLCNWRSAVPQVAVEAVLLRPANERMDTAGAMEELVRSSFVDVSFSNADDTALVAVPLVAALFGRRKLTVSPMKSAVEADTALLRTLGAAQQADSEHGIGPRLERMFREIADRVIRRGDRLDEYLPTLQYLARRYSRGWLLLASLYAEIGTADALDRAKEAYSSYLEFSDDEEGKRRAWLNLADLCHRTDDPTGEVQAVVEMCQLQSIPFGDLSRAANRINRIFRERYDELGEEERQILAQRLIHVIGSRIEREYTDAGDFARLGWLCLHSRDQERARYYKNRGVALEPDNQHLVNLARRLST